MSNVSKCEKKMEPSLSIMVDTADKVSNPGNYVFSFIQLYIFSCLHTMTSITSIVL